MKIQLSEIPTPSIEDFADTHGLVMEVHERKLPVGDPARFYAHFKHTDAQEGEHCLIGLFGNGSTPEDAIAEYAEKISLRTLIVEPFTTEHRAIIDVPRLKTTKP